MSSRSKTGPGVESWPSDTPTEFDGYSVVRFVAEDSIAKVFIAQEAKHSRVVALKILKNDSCADRDARKRLEKDVRAAADIVHPNVARVYKTGRLSNGMSYIADEYVGGRAVADLMSDARTMEESMRILMGLARALKAAHAKGFAHGNLNANNVFIERDSGRVIVKDFEMRSLSRAIGATSADDILSFGKLANELLPASATEPSLTQALAKCLENDPDARPTAGELARLLDDGKPAEPLLTSKQSTQRAAELSLMRVAVIGALFFVVLGVVVALWILVGVQF